MAGLPAPMPVSRDKDYKILSIADLEKVASDKLDKTTRGEVFLITVYHNP